MLGKRMPDVALVPFGKILHGATVYKGLFSILQRWEIIATNPMLAGMFTKVFERLSRAGNGALFLIFLGGSFLIRFPFFFRDYVDRDESTFILMAQSLVDGHLPYTQLWDLKPPLLFLIFALPIWVFGKSMVAIRLMGLLAVSGIDPHDSCHYGTSYII